MQETTLVNQQIRKNFSRDYEFSKQSRGIAENAGGGGWILQRARFMACSPDRN
jgi:hypothetical protein